MINLSALLPHLLDIIKPVQASPKLDMPLLRLPPSLHNLPHGKQVQAQFVMKQNNQYHFDTSSGRIILDGRNLQKQLDLQGAKVVFNFPPGRPPGRVGVTITLAPDVAARAVQEEPGGVRFEGRLENALGTEGWKISRLMLPQENGALAPFPLLWGREEIEEDGAEGKKGELATHFLINLSLGAIGPMQVEGVSTKKRLGLTLRTYSPLSKDMQHELSVLYSNLLEATGMVGSIRFKAEPQDWKKPKLANYSV